MIVHVGFALVLTIRVPVRVVRVAHRSVIVLVRVTGVEVIETTRHLVVVVSHVKVVVSVSQSLVLVMLPVSGWSVVSHIHSRWSLAGRWTGSPFHTPSRGSSSQTGPAAEARGQRVDRSGAPR